MDTLTGIESRTEGIAPNKWNKETDTLVTLTNATVAVITEGEKWGLASEAPLKERPSWNIILTDETLTSPVTVKCNQAKVDDEVVTGAVVGKFEYKATNKGGSVRNTVKFGKPWTGGAGGGSGGGTSRPSTPPPKESEEAKVVGVFGHLVKDVMISGPDPFNWEEFHKQMEATSKTAWILIKELKAQ